VLSDTSGQIGQSIEGFHDHNFRQIQLPVCLSSDIQEFKQRHQGGTLAGSLAGSCGNFMRSARRRDSSVR
jgi:hypothetical protein